MRTFRKIAQPYFAAKAEEAKNGGAEGVKVVSELPETGKDGDLVLVKTEKKDVDISQLEVDVYSIGNGATIIVDKNNVFDSSDTLDNDVLNFFEDIMLKERTFYQCYTASDFAELVNNEEILLIEKREELIGNSERTLGNAAIKQGTCKIGELNFIECPADNLDPQVLGPKNIVTLLIGTKGQWATIDLNVGSSESVTIPYRPITEGKEIVG